MKKLFLLIILCLGLAASAQAQKTAWAQKIAGTSSDYAQSISTDTAGNTYVAGYFNSSTLTFNNGISLTNTNTSNDAYLAKYSSAGICLWAERLSGTAAEQVLSIVADLAGNVYVAGNFSSTVMTLNNGKTLSYLSSGTDGFIAKYNSSGQCLWAERIAGTNTDYAQSLAVDTSGNVFVAGYFNSSSISFNNAKTLSNTNNFNDAYIAKYDSTGLCQWAKGISGTGFDYAQSVACDPQGNVVVAGYYTSPTLSLSNNKELPNINTNNEAFLAKYNTTGVCLWAKNISGTNNEYAQSLVIDKSGSIIVAGYFTSSLTNFNNNVRIANSGGNDGFIAKYNPMGLCQWAEKIGGTADDRVQSVAVDAKGNVYTCGVFKSPTIALNYAIGLINVADYDSFVLKYNASGKIQWAEKITGAGADYAQCVAVDINDYLYLAGYYASDPLSFNNGISLTNSGSNDAFISKIKPKQYLASPVNIETGMPLNSVLLTAFSMPNTENYRFQLSTNQYFSTTLIDTLLLDTSLTINNLINLTKYYWRVQSYRTVDTSDWSDTWNFTAISVHPRIFVKFNAQGLSNGTSWANAYNFLQQALDYAQPGDSIFVAAGTYKPTIKVDGITDRHKAFGMKHGVGIYGGFNGTETHLAQRNIELYPTTLSGDIGVQNDSLDNCYHIFNTQTFLKLDTNSKLDGFIITKGYVNEFNPDNKGAAMIFNNNGSPLIQNCVFTQNRTTYRGGAIYNGETSPVFINCKFENNSSNNEGGAIYDYYSHNTSFVNCTFSYNRSLASAGGVIYSHLTENELIDNCQFYDNQAYTSGGAVYIGGTIKNSAFNNNKCTSSSTSNGGAIYLYSDALVQNCTFSGNNIPSSGKGGAIASFSNSRITGSTFTGNFIVGTGYGGAVYCYYDTYIDNSTFSGNYCSGSNGSGGALSSNSYNLFLSECNFWGNYCSVTSTASGGAIYSANSIDNCLIANNYCTSTSSTAACSGGAIYFLKSLSNSKVTNNWAGGNNSLGGGIYNGSTSTIDIKNSIISSNNASLGGGVYCAGFINIVNSTITNNTSTKGGGLYVLNYSTSSGIFNITNTILFGNIATIDGNEFYKAGGTMNVLNSCYGNSNGDMFGQIDVSMNNINSDPLFVDAPNGDYRLYGVSPCINLGDNTAINEPYDVRGEGFPRKLSDTADTAGTIDIGAIEYRFGIDPYLPPQMTSPELIVPFASETGVSTSAAFAWTSVAGATLYRLQISNTMNFAILTANQLQPDTTAIITDLLPFSTYYWRVFASNVADSSLWSGVRSFTTELSTPIQISPQNTLENVPLSPSITWNYSFNATSYRLQVSQSSSFDTFETNIISFSTSVPISSLKYNTQYFWRVRAYSTTDSSGWSPTWSFYSVPAPVPPSWAVTSQTGNSATIGFVPTGTYKIGYRDLRNGDAIGVFFTADSVQKCGGYFVWDGFNFGIVAWGDDDYTTTIKEGFSVNEPFIFKIWDSQKQITYTANKNIVSGPANYTINGITTVDLATAILSVTQNINLTTGWNLVSANVTPDTLAMSHNMSPLVGKLQLAKSFNGQIYSPPFQTSLSSWNVMQAYLMRMNAAATLPMTGIRVQPETMSINLTIGANWMPYFRTSSLPTGTALNSIQGKYVQVKTIGGLVYQPPFFLSLSQLQPGFGYIITMSQIATLKYPANAVVKPIADEILSLDMPKIFALDNNHSGKSSVIAMDLQNVEDGDEIGVFTRDGMLVGSSVWQYGMHGVVVWGDDESTNVKDGATEGEPLSVKIWSKATKNIGEINQISLNDMTNNAEIFELTYKSDAVNLLKGKAELFSQAKLNISPQPASNELLIKLIEKSSENIEINILNQTGKLCISQKTNASDGVLRINISELPSGVYQLIMNIDGKVYGEKVVVVR